jgi:hypothetical protein
MIKQYIRIFDQHRAQCGHNYPQSQKYILSVDKKNSRLRQNIDELVWGLGCSHLVE